MNRKFISKSDFILRRVLNSESSLEILKNFIEVILEIKIKEIKLNPYLSEKSKDIPKEENLGIVDVRIKTDEDEEINVGIQFADGEYVHTKILMYYAQIHLNQLKYEDKRKFARTITINILDFIYLASLKYDRKIKIKNKDKNINLDELELYIIELPKFHHKTDELVNDKQEWIKYLKGCNNETLGKIKNKNILKLDKLLEKYWEKEKIRENY